MENAVYEKLAKHLDKLPGGFPPTDSGVELRILKRLFTPHEAEIATALRMKLDPPSAIAKQLDMNESELTPLLESMSKKGLILRSGKKGKNHYMAAQFMVGIWEYHVNDLNEALIHDANEYIPHLMKEIWVKQKTRQLRVIPISKSISAEMNVMAYEEAEKIIRAESKIVVAPCICRKEHEMVGKGCGKLQEACLIFGGGAFFYEENGLGRPISQEEALEILNKGIEQGLVLQPGNSQKPMNICMCCGCCCQVLKNLNKLEEPAKAVCSNYYVTVNEENCTACGTCEERCQMNAITVEDTAQVSLARCIGCGICVAACDSEAMVLVEKDASEKYIPPKNTVRMYMKLAQGRGVM
ncbi:4Fe-4S binding protein [Desulfonema magnum]|uniref:4Fe-4S ferredoxin iron-sulfur binding domain-containing protein n=1 Tax=Desulfonema magnum TaxID=45655 RepID=A0A975BM50_9BACT|nr:4Fe-4S binding protein [Desulfonema magnum]QTA88234.1 4Fe-4S ferredoxin iron-sulfur binding domain-containing protein [Desulfonema magnum]